MKTIKRIAFTGVLTGLALITYILESLLPSIYLPGAKIGLSNIFTMIAVIVAGLPEGLMLTIVRTVLGCIITGNVSAIIYSCPAGIVATVTIYALYRIPKRRISVIAVSTAAATVHNLTQNAVFCLVTETAENFVLLPYLGVFGVISGITVGVIVLLILKTVPTSIWNGVRNKGGNIENSKR